MVQLRGMSYIYNEQNVILLCKEKFLLESNYIWLNIALYLRDKYEDTTQEEKAELTPTPVSSKRHAIFVL